MCSFTTSVAQLEEHWPIVPPEAADNSSGVSIALAGVSQSLFIMYLCRHRDRLVPGLDYIVPHSSDQPYNMLDVVRQVRCSVHVVLLGVKEC